MLFSVNKINYDEVRYRSHFKSIVRFAVHVIYCKIYYFLFCYRKCKYKNSVY